MAELGRNPARIIPAWQDFVAAHAGPDRPVRGIYCASPDSECLAAQKLPYTAEQTKNGCIYTVKLPDVRCWTAVWVQLEE